MEAAASLTTLIAFTLQSAKFVYQSIDGIRDGPSIITNSTQSIKHLEGLLQQLLELIRRSEQHRQYHDATSWNLLEEKISHCSKDLKEASGKLKALSPDDAKNRVDKAWKRIKLSLKESFFTRLDAQTRKHVVEIQLQLDIINRYVSIHITSYLAQLSPISNDEFDRAPFYVLIMNHQEVDFSVFLELWVLSAI